MQNRILETRLINWREIEPLQPDNAKVIMNYAALEHTLLKYGFAQPFYGWLNKGKVYCIDGHSRKEILLNMDNVPDQLHCTFIDAKNRKEAIAILTEVYNQKHSPFDLEVLSDWTTDEGFEEGEIDFDSMNTWSENGGSDDDDENESGENSNGGGSDDIIVKVTCLTSRDAETLIKELEAKGYECKANF